MNGGIEFATPSQAGPVAKSQQKFTLAPVAPKDLIKWNPFLDWKAAINGPGFDSVLNGNAQTSIKYVVCEKMRIFNRGPASTEQN